MISVHSCFEKKYNIIFNFRAFCIISYNILGHVSKSIHVYPTIMTEEYNNYITFTTRMLGTHI